jgi:hypothetical protein
VLSAVVAAVAATAGCGSGDEPPPAVSIDPPAVELTALQSQTFTARVSGLGDTAVDWSADGGAFLAQDGTSASWLAPALPGSYKVIATAHAAPAASAAAAIDVVAAGATAPLVLWITRPPRRSTSARA